MECDLRELVLMILVVPANDFFKYFVGSRDIQLLPIVLGENVAAILPVAADKPPVE